MRPKAVTVPGAPTFAGCAIMPNQGILRRQRGPVAMDKEAFEAHIGRLDMLTTADLESVFSQSLFKLLGLPHVHQRAIIIKFVNSLAFGWRIDLFVSKLSYLQFGKCGNTLGRKSGNNVDLEIGVRWQGSD
jgi:hypothetical protein